LTVFFRKFQKFIEGDFSICKIMSLRVYPRMPMPAFFVIRSKYAAVIADLGIGSFARFLIVGNINKASVSVFMPTPIPNAP